AVPVVFRERLTALLVLGPRRRDLPYTSENLRILKIVATQSAVALEHARAYHALQAALRRVQILESIRAGLSKFVPRTVQRLIEQAPDAPELAKRETDVSVLFVDIAGYTRLAGRLDAATVDRLVERYFGAFLDEILKNGGDVNETAGDGLMVIFQDADPRRHARSAVTTGLALLRRAREINAAEPLDEPTALHVGVNSGRAPVGATLLAASMVVAVVVAPAPRLSAQTVGDVFRRVQPSVVVIRATGRDATTGGGAQVVKEVGSGVLISSDDAVRVGDQVIVVGAPYGLVYSMSVGWISARWGANTVYKQMPLADFFQTTTTINQGNSGGPMFDIAGEVIGIVSHNISKSGGSEGLGFIPVGYLASYEKIRDELR